MRRKAWVVLLGALAVVLIAYFGIRVAVGAKLNPKIVQAELSKSLGLDVQTEQVKLGWTGQFELIGVRLTSESEPFLSAKAAKLNLHLIPLLRRQIQIQSLTLQNPSLELNPALAGRLSKLLSNRAPSKETFPITIANGNFDYTAQNGRKISFEKIKGKVQIVPGLVPIQLELADANGGLYQLSGTISAGSLNLQGKVKNIALKAIAAPFAINPVPEFQGNVNGDFTAIGNPSNVAINSNFVVTSGVFKGNVAVAGAIESTPLGTAVHGKLYSSKGTIQNVGAYKSFGLNFSTPKQGFVFQDGVLEFDGGTLQFNGGINKKNGITIGFKSSAFDPFSLSNLKGWGVQGSPGTIIGEASGVFPRLAINIRGRFPSLQFGAHALKNPALILSANLTSGPANLNRFEIISPDGAFVTSGKLSWDQQKNLRFALNGIDAYQLAKIFGLGSRLAPMDMNTSADIYYNYADKQWTGLVTSGNGVIVGQAFNRFNGNFSYRTGKPLDFSGAFLMNGRRANISGTWKDQVGNVNLDAENFPVERIPMLGNRLVGFHGIATIHAKFSTDTAKEASADFALSQGSYRGAALPAISGSMRSKANLLTLSPLQVALNPPLSLHLTYNMQSKAVQFSGRLTGQNPGALLSLFPGQSIPMSGSLSGDLTGSGVYPHITVAFNGDVRNAHFQGFVFDQGKLSLHGTLPNALAVTFDTNRFDLGKFALVRQFLPTVEGIGSLHVSGGLGGRTVIGLHFNQIRISGKALGPMDGNFAASGNRIEISRLTLPITTPPLAAAGSINLSQHTVSISSRLDGQRISDLALLLHKSIAADGNLYGEFKAEGSLPRPSIVFSGSGKNLKFAGMDIANAALAMHGTPSASGYDLAIRGSDISAESVATLQKAFPGLTGTVGFAVRMVGSNVGTINFNLTHGSWKGKAFPALGGTVTYEAPLARFSHLSIGAVSPAVEASGQYNSDTHAFQFGANLDGQNAGELLKLTGASIGDVGANLYGPLNLSGTSAAMNATFSGTAKNIRFHGLSFGSGHLDMKAVSDAVKHFTVHLAASGIPASSVGFLAAHYPGLSGDLNLNVAMNTATPSEASITFALLHPSRHGAAFPEIDAKGLWTAPTLQISPLSVGVSPPLALSGSVNTQTQGLHLSGELTGQSIGSLMSLAGGSVSEVSGNLEGPLTVGGSTGAPELDFHGTVSNLVYKGMRLGEGRLDLASTSSALNGKLTLDNPIAVNPENSLLGAAISRIPGIGNILGQVASSVEVTGVLLRGSPQHPEITPTIQRAYAQQQAPSPFGNPQHQGAPTIQNPINSILNQIFH